MSPFLLKQVWLLVETTQSHILLNLDDRSLVEWLLGKLKSQQSLDRQQAHVLNDYIHSKLSLIRDLAQQRGTPDLL